MKLNLLNALVKASVFAGLLISVLVMLLGGEPQAASAAGVGTITGITTIAANDSNHPTTQGPRAMYLEVSWLNDSGSNFSNVSAALVFGSGCTGFNFAGGQINPLTPTQVPQLATVNNGDTVVLYWYVLYPTTNGNTCNYTVTINGTPANGSGQLITTSSISAQAGGGVSSLNAGPGTTGTLDVFVGYTNGNPGGTGDLVIQPTGQLSFDASCFQLTKELVTGFTGYTAGVANTDTNILQYSGVTGGSSNTLSVEYIFQILCAGSTTTFEPFAFQDSGSNLKYSGNFGQTGAISTTPLMGSQSNPTSASSLPTSVTDTVYLQNPSGISTLPAGQVQIYLCGPFDIPPHTGTHPLPPNGQACNTDSAGNISGSPPNSGLLTLGTVGTAPNQYTTASWTPPNITQFGEWCFAAVYTPNVSAYTTTTLNARSTTIPSHVPGGLTGTECITIQGPTAVTLSSFEASTGVAGGSSQLSLAWATGSEINTAGFNLYRSEAAAGPYVRINSDLIPASNDSLAGGKYQFVDSNVIPGRTYFYQLEDVELNGRSIRHPAVQVTAPSAAALGPGPVMMVGLGIGLLGLAAAGTLLLRRKARQE